MKLKLITFLIPLLFLFGNCLSQSSEEYEKYDYKLNREWNLADQPQDYLYSSARY